MLSTIILGAVTLWSSILSNLFSMERYIKRKQQVMVQVMQIQSTCSPSKSELCTKKKKKCRNLDSSPSLGLLFPFPHPCSKLWHLFALLFLLISASLYCTPLHVAYNFIFSSNDLPLSSATRLTVYPVFSARLPSV